MDSTAEPWTPCLELLDEGQPVDGPNLWWPEDRAWCCATDIDHVSSYVGGSRAFIGEILASCLETLEVAADARIDRQADTINTRGDNINN